MARRAISRSNAIWSGVGRPGHPERPLAPRIPSTSLGPALSGLVSVNSGIFFLSALPAAGVPLRRGYCSTNGGSASPHRFWMPIVALMDLWQIARTGELPDPLNARTKCENSEFIRRYQSPGIFSGQTGGAPCGDMRLVRCSGRLGRAV
jgi:hypothetical protein